MNPFDLAGPPFLLFFIVLSVAVIAALRATLRSLEGTAPFAKPVLLDDPYAIAMLRGGQAEATRVATVSLVDRGLLKAKPHGLVGSTPNAVAYAQRPIERAILTAFNNSDSAINILKTAPAAVTAACEAYKAELKKLGLLASSANTFSRLMPFAIALVLIEGTAIVKIQVALARGHHNIGFLIPLAVIALIVLLVSILKPRTAYGDLVLSQHRARFETLKLRATKVKPGGATNEAALLAALWGLAVLPTTGFPYVKDLYPKAAKTTSDSWSGGGCGGGCSGGGGGSGCGGGGCGGGCGGCGG